ncbi:transcriptional regulator [Nocardioides cavernaquae]|uniref:Transcriptional regulator n=1 Tax=Nocardioides cavernaquae TaxID=2321396 RepID=A0A3A5HJ02_9ACTN|nr:transcriptional regulator [Nocardioides cavernaquae]
MRYAVYISKERLAAQSRTDFDAFMATCPTRQVVSTLGDKWAGLVVNALAGGPKRHGELMRRINGASQKMLTHTLRTLERDGLVSRSVTPTVPMRVDYELTALGRDVLPVLAALKAWSEAHIMEVLEARDSYDAARAMGETPN